MTMNDELPQFIEGDDESPESERVIPPPSAPQGLSLASKDDDEIANGDAPPTFDSPHDENPAEDSPPSLDSIPDDDLRGFVAALRARGTLPPLQEVSHVIEEEQEAHAAGRLSETEKAQLEADLERFLQVTGQGATEEEEEEPLETPDEAVAEIIEEEPPPPFAPSPPDFVDEDEDDLEQFLADLRNPAPHDTDSEPEFIADDDDDPLPEYLDYVRPTIPTPDTQSGFVNPALARVAAAQSSKPPREPSQLWLGFRTIAIILSAALISAFIFNYWTPDSFLSESFVANLQEVSSTQGPPTAIPSPLPTFARVQTVGIIIGHSGPPLNPQFTVDPGAICDENNDGVPELTELDINTTVGMRVADLLVAAGYEVELLNEWDARIENYRASTLLSIHTNTCENLGFGATGFNVKASERSPLIDRDNKLVDCLAANYANATGLPRHFGSPPDLVDYHAFRKVSIDTPTVIIELGFMFANRDVLTQRPDDMAQGIFRGLDCFLTPNSMSLPETP